MVTKVARAAIATIACRRCPTVVSCDVALCRCAPCRILSCRVMFHIDLRFWEYHGLCADLPSVRHAQYNSSCLFFFSFVYEEHRLFFFVLEHPFLSLAACPPKKDKVRHYCTSHEKTTKR